MSSNQAQAQLPQPQVQQQHQGSNNSLSNSPNLASPHLVPTLNTIKKRKIKFNIQLNIEELLSVPYLNGVLFCKIRLCDGGNHVSYSSKQEVNNSKVLWSIDPPIQFDVKVIQLYSTANSIHDLNNSNQTEKNQKIIIIGYEPCLCRVSVRKELRGGKSYQKLGYVDYNLCDYILKNNSNQDINEYCVNRVLKEYDNMSKKNQQRLDNSYLKIKIKINDQVNTNLSQKFNIPKLLSNNNNNTKKKSSTSSSSSSSSSTPSSASSPENSSPMLNNISSQSMINTGSNKLTSHTRNLSLTSNLTSNLGLNSINLNKHISNNPHGHNRSCSNGSIKSNFSFDFIIKNRNKKLIEDIQSNSSASSNNNSGVLSAQSGIVLNNKNQKTVVNSLSNSSSILYPSSNIVNSSSSTSSIPLNSINLNYQNKLEPANLKIIETRIDANEIISEIENELTNKIINNKNTNN